MCEPRSLKNSTASTESLFLEKHRGEIREREESSGYRIDLKKEKKKERTRKKRNEQPRDARRNAEEECVETIFEV